MKKIAFCISLLCIFLSVQAQDVLQIKQPQIPILIERGDNVLFYIRLDAKNSTTLEEVTLNLKGNMNLSEIKALKLYYSGTESVQRKENIFYAPVQYLSRSNPAYTLSADESYSVKKTEVNNIKEEVTLQANQKLFPGINYFWVSIEMNSNASLLSTFSAEIIGARADGKPIRIEDNETKNRIRRLGVGVRHAGDDGVTAYRIPGLVTSKKGTLIGVYDIRYNRSNDLQEKIDIGVSRSMDKGQTWEPMQVAMTFGEYGGLPHAQNGVGDPAILVDDVTGTIWIIAAWTHGMGNHAAWFNSMPGMTPEETAQLMLVKSEDDGMTWSEPINITSQVKDPSWYFLLQGPGMGITMQDGTLVFPIQFINAERIPNAGVMYSKDRGETWHIHNLARTNTTEAQVAEVEPGVLMLNMRDNRGGSRAVSVTKDLGKTWTQHPSNRSALREPVCMASLIKIHAKDNVLGKDILLFSNPDTTKGRNHITIKASLDGGLTWPEKYQIMLDEEEGWGYSCLTQIDRETVGILYEGSTAHMIFQAVALTDLIQQ